MKYAAVVLFNNHNPLSSVGYGAACDALLAGGVFLDEVALLPYDAPSSLDSTLSRLSLACDGIFVICDGVLLKQAREAVERVAETAFSEEFHLETERTLFATLPADERGAEIVREETIPRVDARRKNRFNRVVIRTVMAPQEKLVSVVRAATEAGQGKLWIHVGEEFGSARIEIIYDANTPKMLADDVVRLVVEELGETVYAVADVPIAARLFECLKLHRLHIATAESFTGGGVGQAIVANPGASSVFYEGLNTYDTESKISRLGVKKQTIFEKGAVSNETAYEMAAGLIAQGNCDIAIATTGAAGPDPDGAAPAGLFYIAIGTRERVRVYGYRVAGNRETVTKTAINYALYLAYREIR